MFQNIINYFLGSARSTKDTALGYPSAYVHVTVDQNKNKTNLLSIYIKPLVKKINIINIITKFKI